MASSLTSGTRLGTYEILSVLGEGGMGVVYRARDGKLGRDVAIKVLLPEVAGNPERLARFDREARTLAALNHPQIAQIYGLEEGPEGPFLVLELVEGPTLADLLTSGSRLQAPGSPKSDTTRSPESEARSLHAIPLDEALAIARQIAAALEAAHEQGIVHRDLKPGNVKVRPDGAVKVLDFGLAKAMESASPAGASAVTNSPTITSPALMTSVGMLIGTAAYMAPEQAKGRQVDKRSDVWAFGCVLYEMLTGTRAFAGDDVAEVMAEVIKVNIDWSRLESVPNAGVLTLLRRCLRKDPRQRLGDGGAIRLEIDELLASPSVPPIASRPRTVSLARALAIGAAIVAVSVAVTMWLRTPAAPPLASSMARLALNLPPGTELRDGASATISRDGTQVAFAASRGGVAELYIRKLSDSESRLLGNTRGASNPFFSPDGSWVGFFAGNRLKKVSVTGGVVVDLAEARAEGNNGWGSWGPTDTILFRSQTGLATISGTTGGEARSVLTADQVGQRPIAHPSQLAGGQLLLADSAGAGTDTPDQRTIDLVTLSTGERRVLVQGGVFPQFLKSGHLVFLRGGSLMAVPFDAAKLETLGPPIEVLKGIRTTFNGSGVFSCSDGGNCVYVTGSTVAERAFVMVDRMGAAQPLRFPPSNYTQPRFSPSGNRLVFWLEQNRCDIAIADLERGNTTKLTSEGDNHFPIWMNNERVAYISRKPGAPAYALFSRPANGANTEDSIRTQPLGPIAQLSASPDGTLVFSDREDLWMVPPSGNRESAAWSSSRFVEMMPAFSPDGRWLAYVSDESGAMEVYVRPFPGAGERYPISISGGSEPVWARNGKELFYRNGDQLLAVDVRAQASFSASRPRVLFSGAYARSEVRTNYDVSPDGQHFVMLTVAGGDQAPTQINVLINWFDELKRLVPK